MQPRLPGHRYGGAWAPGSCFSCGVAAEWWFTVPGGCPVNRCPNCGPVEHVIIDHAGTQVQGFMTPEDCEREKKLVVLADYRREKRKGS